MFPLAVILGAAGLATVVVMGSIFGVIAIFGSRAKKLLQQHFASVIDHFGMDMDATLETPKKGFPSIEGYFFGRGFHMYMTKKTSGDSTIIMTHYALEFKTKHAKLLVLRKETKIHRLQKRMGNLVEHEIGWAPFDKLYLLKTQDGQYLDNVFDDKLVDLFIDAYSHMRGYFEVVGSELIYTESLSINSHKQRLRFQKMIELGLFMADRLEWTLND
ncbi:MAG: hypothetical protein AAF598_16410 [Bacteroidota bacterium]